MAETVYSNKRRLHKRVDENDPNKGYMYHYYELGKNTHLDFPRHAKDEFYVEGLNWVSREVFEDIVAHDARKEEYWVSAYAPRMDDLYPSQVEKKVDQVDFELM